MIGLLFAVFEFAKVCKKALADGWQPDQDIPVIVEEAVKDLLPVVLKFIASQPK